jgi:membrane fusion protein, multidrug efflux system
MYSISKAYPARLFALALAVVLGAPLLASCGKGHSEAKAEEAAADTSVPVEVAPISRRSISASYSGTATLEPESEAQVAAKISGVLLKLTVEEGDQVKAGQVLARLDDENPRLNLAKAKASLDKLENDYRRSSEMFERKLLSVEQNDKIRYDLETQRATYDLARLELSYTNIVAPISGVISKRLVKIGNFIQVNQALFQIDNFDPLLAVLNVPERELNTLRVDQVVSMRVDSIPDHAFEGRIQRISPVVDSATGTFRVTCEFRDESGRLKSGMFGRLEVIYAQHQDVPTIPRSALVEEDGETAVFVVISGADAAAADMAAKKITAEVASAEADKAKPKAEPGKDVPPIPAWVAKRRLIKAGYGDAEYVEVLDGLAEGDRVITLGRSAVRDGTAVQVLEGVK